MKLTCVIHVYKSMFPVENGTFKANVSDTETNFSDTLQYMGKNLKHIY